MPVTSRGRLFLGGALALVILIALLMVLRGGDVQGQDDYPEGPQVRLAVQAVDAAGVRARTQPDTFVATLTRVGQRPAVPTAGTRVGAGVITFFGVTPGEYIARLVDPRGETARIRVAEDQVTERRLSACVGADCP